MSTPRSCDYRAVVQAQLDALAPATEDAIVAREMRREILLRQARTVIEDLTTVLPDGQWERETFLTALATRLMDSVTMSLRARRTAAEMLQPEHER